MTDEQRPRCVGWGWTDGVRKWHYWTETGHSACGRYFKFTDAGLSDDNDASPDNCAACRRKVAGRRAKATT